jgi:tetratricopeptide (TPR) repeat protein
VAYPVPKKVLASVLIVTACGILLYRTWWLFMAAWITRQGNPDPAIYERAIRYDPQNADYHFVLAQIYNYSTPYLNLPRAQAEYEAAVRLNPDRAAYWLELSKYYEQLGNKGRCLSAMQMALKNDPNYAQTHWAAANLYVRIGDLKSADVEFHRTAELDDSYVQQVLDLASRFSDDSRKLIETIVPDTKPADLLALSYFISQKNEDGAALVWERLRAFNTTPQERAPYVDHLVSIGLPHRALGIFSYGNSESPEFFNGDFEMEPMNRSFDWHFSSSENAKARRDTAIAKSGQSSFLVVFDGKENVDYNDLWHWLPVDKGRNYNLTFWMKTDAISTDEGMFVEVDGHASGKRTGSNDWEEFTISFIATADLVTVRLRRAPSRKLDNLLKGRVWVDAFSLG